MSTVFTKIILGEIPSEKIYEDDFMICIKDINPVSKVHLLCITKKPYLDYSDFVQNASENEVAAFFKKTSEIANKFCLEGFKILTNNGAKAGQEIFHFHVHIIG